MYRITKNGKPLDPKLYTIDEVNRFFSSNEDCLVLSFAGENGWFFRIKYSCRITTGNHCIIHARDDCKITTRDSCNIDTGFGCNITAGDQTVIRTYWDSVITGGEYCVVTRNDTNQVYILMKGQTMKLNSRDVEGYEVVKTIEIEGKKYNKKEIKKLLKQFNQLIKCTK